MNLCKIKKKLKTLGLKNEDATKRAWRIFNHVNGLVKSTNQDTKLFEKIFEEQFKDVKNMSWEECLKVAAKSGVSDAAAFCGWMKKQGRVT